MSNRDLSSLLSQYTELTKWKLPTLQTCSLAMEPLTVTSATAVQELLKQHITSSAEGWVLFQSTGPVAFGPAPLVPLTNWPVEAILSAEIWFGGDGAKRSLSIKYIHGNDWRGALYTEGNGATHLAQAIEHIADKPVLRRSFSEQGKSSDLTKISAHLNYTRYWAPRDGVMRQVAARFVGFSVNLNDQEQT